MRVVRLGIILPIVVLGAVGATNAVATASDIVTQGKNRFSATVDVVLVPPEKPWMLAVAAPIIARLGEQGAAPLLIASGGPPSRALERFFHHLDVQQCLLLVPRGTYEPIAWLTESFPEVTALGLAEETLPACTLLAQRFWQRPKTIVLAALDDPEGAILGSALAAHQCVPLLLCEPGERRTAVTGAMAQVGADSALLAVSQASHLPLWARDIKQQVQVLQRGAIEEQIVAKLKPQNIRNIVLTRVPEMPEGIGQTAWLAPYLSIARGSPVVMCSSNLAMEAEESVTRLVRQHKLRPQTVTILADYDAISCKSVRLTQEAENTDNDPRVVQVHELSNEMVSSGADGVSDIVDSGSDDDSPDMDANPQTVLDTPDGLSIDGNAEVGGADDSSGLQDSSGTYEVITEPLVPTDCRELAVVGVGRIPFASVQDASILFARGLARPRLLAMQSPRMLMVANPVKDSLTLPLCETISRATASDLKNARIHVDEFYTTPSDHPDTLAAAGNAHLIVYQGHLYHQQLFKTPDEFEQPLEEDGEISEPILPSDEMPSDQDERPQGKLRLAATGWSDPAMAAPLPASLQPSREQNLFLGAHSMSTGIPILPFPLQTDPGLLDGPEGGDPESTAPFAMPAVESIDLAPPPELLGMPAVILQTCDSLNEQVFAKVLETGGVAMVGSASHIHSGSGSSLMKALCDGLVYRGDTVGTALRDARNYFFCLQELKDRRGHRQQVKGLRVALSFQLWGDPEMEVFPSPAPRPRIPPVSARYGKNGDVVIDVPDQRLRTSRTGEVCPADVSGQ